MTKKVKSKVSFCPMTFNYPGGDPGMWQCAKENCAWWHTQNNECCIRTIGINIGFIAGCFEDGIMIREG